MVLDVSYNRNYEPWREFNSQHLSENSKGLSDGVAAERSMSFPICEI